MLSQHVTTAQQHRLHVPLSWEVWLKTSFGVELSLFFCGLLPSLLLSHLIRRPWFSQTLNTPHYSSIPSVCILCMRQPKWRTAKVQSDVHTGGQSGLCQQWRIVMFDDENKVVLKREWGGEDGRKKAEFKESETERLLKTVNQRGGRWVCRDLFSAWTEAGSVRVHPAQRVKASASAHKHLVDFAKSCTTSRELS